MPLGLGACALRLAQEGAHVAVLDIDAPGASETAQDIESHYGEGRAVAVACDVSDESQVERAFESVLLAYGGIDIVVNNAGIAHSAPISETRLEDWERLYAILARGYFLVARAAFRIWQTQNTGRNLIFITSKNALVPGKAASAYSSAKASELHLARCLAEEGGIGVRVNSIAPDAVLHGSRIWDSDGVRSVHVPTASLQTSWKRSTASARPSK